MSQNHNSVGLPPEDIDMVATWLQADRTRWMAGVITGAIAGCIALIVAGILAVMNGSEFVYPIKLMATMVLGFEATDLTAGLSTLVVGFLVFEAITAFWGFVYSHFVRAQSFGGLFVMGAVWGFFSWVFQWNLFFHSFKPILYSGVEASAAFVVCMAYGLSMSLIGSIDRALR